MRAAAAPDRPRSAVRRAILTMERPFRLADLVYLLRTQYGVRDRRLISAVLDELCESGAVRFEEAEENEWSFAVKAGGSGPRREGGTGNE